MAQGKKRVAIIPARGGSKRLPGKNIMDFKGKPMIAWTIEAAIESNLFDSVVVSTDNDEIAKVSQEWGAEVPFLRRTAADDFSQVSDATLSTIDQLEEHGRYYDEVIQLFAVCPLRNSADIVDSYHYFEKQKIEFLISCFKYVWMNPWWAVTKDDQGRPKRMFDQEIKRSQDMATLYCPTGAIWIANVNALKRDQSFYGTDHRFWEMNWKRAVDIDNMDDVELAKLLF